MGGNALTEGLTRRHDKSEFFIKSLEVIDRMLHARGVSRVQLIESYRSKETFGDSDILYSTLTDEPYSVEDIRELFPESKEISRNTSVISLEYCELQVDLIHVKMCEFNYALNYFAHNDLGNLCGKIAHQLGLKHGHRGLTLPIRDGDNIVGEVMLTRYHRTALHFLGLNPDTFACGFDTLEDIFKFVRSSKYFSPESYKLENLNTIAKMRDKKRTTYRAFLGYNEANPVSNPYVKVSNKLVHLEHIFDYFGEAVLEEYTKVTRELAFTRYIKTRFNGDIVSKLTGYTGKGLGQFMQHLRKNEFLLNPHSIPLLDDVMIVDIVMKNAKQFDKVL
jgi:hypothetical protein